MSHPLVSVVMPVRSGGGLLDQAIASITNQTLSHFEFLVVDDGADAETAAGLDRVARHDARVNVIHQPALGIVSALNAGCRVARGKYIARMDADDVSYPERLKRQVDLLESEPAIGLVGGQVRCSDVSGRMSWAVTYPTGDAEIRAMLPVGNPFSHPAVTMRRDLFISAGGYREAFRHAEDYDLWVRLLDSSQGANLPDEVLRYTVHLGQSAFRDWRAQTLSMVAIQTSLRTRAVTGHDLLSTVEKVTEEFVLGLGVTTAQLHSVYVTSLVSQSILAGRIGTRDERRRLLEAAVAESRGIRLPPEVGRRLWAAVAALAVEDRAPLRAVAAARRAARGNERAILARVRGRITGSAARAAKRALVSLGRS